MHVMDVRFVGKIAIVCQDQQSFCMVIKSANGIQTHRNDYLPVFLRSDVLQDREEM